MKYFLLCIFALAVVKGVTSGPVLEEMGSWLREIEPEEKIRGKRRIDLLEKLSDDLIATTVPAVDETAKPADSTPDPTPEPEEDQENERRKKQVLDNVCIKAGGCGRTVCGPVVSARGPSAKMLMHSSQDKAHSAQPRTFEPLLPLSPLASAVTYALPAVPAVPAVSTAYSTDAAAGLGHTILKPAIATPIAHVEPVPLLSHSIPLRPLPLPLMHHPLMNLQRLEVPKIPEIVYTAAEIKEPTPTYAIKPIRPEGFPYWPSRQGAPIAGNYEAPMICHPYDERLAQQVIQIRPEVHVVDGGINQKKLNETVEDFKSQKVYGSEEEEKKVRDHLRQVNEIRDEISQLNKIAQRIVDEQERLMKMQHRQMWNGDARSMERAYAPYMGNGMYVVPVSRANAISYPTSPEEIDFFMQLLKAGKKIGDISQTFQPTLVSALDATKLVLQGNQAGEGAAQEAGGRQMETQKQEKQPRIK